MDGVEGEFFEDELEYFEIVGGGWMVFGVVGKPNMAVVDAAALFDELVDGSWSLIVNDGFWAVGDLE